ncbi:MAG: acetyl-CoA C-acyltransferase [Planctomycetota bacterium]
MKAHLFDLDSVVVTRAFRTPIGKFCGAFKGTDAVRLATNLMKGGLEGAPEHMDADTLILGMARQAGAGPNPARQVQVFSGMPEDRTAWTLNMACGSGLLALVQSAQAVISMGGVSICGGMENMTQVPFILPQMRLGYRLGHAKLHDNMYEDVFHCRLADQLMGATAETLADDYSIKREEQDAYALESQRRCALAAKRGVWKEEIVPIPVQEKAGTVTVSEDEHPRAQTTLDELAKLAPVFRDGGSVTAGNSSGITDGAAAMVVMSGKEARRRGLEPLATVKGYAQCGVDPKRMGLGPVPATRGLLEAAGLTMKDIGLVELNEAFAAQVLACERELRIGSERLNVNGGSIALGHPIGCTGARISVSLLHEMRRRGTRFGVATLCISGGQGLSVLFERGQS